MNILIFGLGLHGGGVQSARFAAERGHRVRITDLKSEDQLRPSLEKLSDLPAVTWRLGGHSADDVHWADLVIKNPGVPDNLPVLEHSSTLITNDIGWYLELSAHTAWAVTGTKGKSTTVSLLAHLLRSCSGIPTAEAGNIGTSPLALLDQMTADRLMLLELSSWQIHDLARSPFRPFDTVVLTPLYRDHLDRYRSFDEYIADKLKIFSAAAGVTKRAVLPASSDSSTFLEQVHAEKIFWYDHRGPLRAGRDGLSMYERRLIFTDGDRTDEIPCPAGADIRHLPALCCAAAAGISLQDAVEAAGSYRGLPHRCEMIAEFGGMLFVNDSAATIPEAAVLAVSHWDKPVHLICGGSDKGLDPEKMVPALKAAASVHLLSGRFTEELTHVCRSLDIPYRGPFSAMQSAFDSAVSQAETGSLVLLSPGAPSFGLFAHEFDRGEQFAACVRALGETR